jgi:glucose/arabinose dehydrogenase
LRNPWRFSFDACSGDLYITDVGQRVYEEINVEPAGTGLFDYGYPQFDGDECVDVATYGCDPAGKVFATAQYRNGADCAIIGGYVYRGHDVPALRGSYFYADHCSGKFWTARYEDGSLSPPEELTAMLNPDGLTGVSSFGEDARGELYVVIRDTGQLFKISARPELPPDRRSRCARPVCPARPRLRMRAAASRPPDRA